MYMGICIACESECRDSNIKPLHSKTMENKYKIYGLCDSHYSIPEERFNRTERKLSKLTGVILDRK